jgi:UDP-N-acetylmuramoyl-tripeptide--D-alanyl-D-alanine ligase
VWLVGDEFGKTTCDYRRFKDVEEVKAAIKEEQPKNYYILIKGSNSMKLFQLPPLL